MSGWIGVDLDGTLAHYEGWKGIDHIGEPVPEMLARVKQWLAEGREVRIFTARVYGIERVPALRGLDTLKPIEDWCVKHIGVKLAITCEKDFGMIELWDDRCVRVLTNKGVPCCE